MRSFYSGADSTSFDALIFGCYEADRLLYVGRTRNGFTPSLRAQLFRRFRGLEIAECPFVNLPEARGGRWGQGLTADKMKECRWLTPVLVGQFEYVEWTPDNICGIQASSRSGKTGTRVWCGGKTVTADHKRDSGRWFGRLLHNLML